MVTHRPEDIMGISNEYPISIKGTWESATIFVPLYNLPKDDTALGSHQIHTFTFISNRSDQKQKEAAVGREKTMIEKTANEANEISTVPVALSVYDNLTR